MKYSEQGFNEKYPLGFLSPANCVMLQTTAMSDDNTPRYCMNPNANGTVSLHYLTEGSYWGSARGYTPLNGLKELSLAQKLEQQK